MALGNWNTAAFKAIHDLSGKSPLLDAFAVVMAQYLPYIMVLGFLASIFFIKERRGRFAFFAFAAASIILSRGILTEFIRLVYNHPRPFDAFGFKPLVAEHGNSFPSGHAAFFFALSGALYFINPFWGIIYGLLSATNGLARIYAGVHFPLDIIGGALVGLGSTAFIRHLFKKHLDKIFLPKSAKDQSALL